MGCAGHNQLEPASCDYADGKSVVSRPDLMMGAELPAAHLS